jgi:hypothetical protein
LLLPQPQKKTKEAEAAPTLETAEQVERSLREDRALGFRALRRQADNNAREGEIRNERAEFELVRDKLYLVLELIAMVIFLIVAGASLLAGGSRLALGALGGAGLSGLIAVLHPPSKPDAPA